MKKILSYIFICIILFNFLLYPVQGTTYSPIFEVFKYEEYEKKWSDEIDTYIQENRNIFIATIMDSERNYDEVSDKVTYDYDIKVHAYWGKKQEEIEHLLTLQSAYREYLFDVDFRYFDVGKTYIFFNKENVSNHPDDNIILKDIGQGNSIKYLSKLGYPDHVYSSEESHMLVDLKTFQETRNKSLGNYEDKNFIYNRNNITQIKNTDKLIKLGGNIFQYEDKILLQNKGRYNLFMFVGDDLDIQELPDYYLLQNNENIYGITKGMKEQTISLIKNLGNIKDIKYKIGNFYEDNSRVYFVNEISDKQRNVYKKLLKKDGDFNILDSLYIEVDYTVTFDSISKELFDKVYKFYDLKIKKLDNDKKLLLLENVLSLKNPYDKYKYSKNSKNVEKYKKNEFILQYLISRLQRDTQNSEISPQQMKNLKHLMGNIYENQGRIYIKKGDKYFYYYTIADDFKIKMVNGYVLIYNDSGLYSVSQDIDNVVVLKLNHRGDFDFDSFSYVEWSIYKDKTYHYIPRHIQPLMRNVGKFGYDIGGINTDYILSTNYDYNVYLSDQWHYLMPTDKKIRDLTIQEKQKLLEEYQLEMKHFGLMPDQYFYRYITVERLKSELQSKKDEK